MIARHTPLLGNFSAEKRCRCLFILFVVFATIASSVLHARENGLIRIGTGGPMGTYYPIGELIARAISNTRGYKECQVTFCNGINIVAVHQASNGSIANATGIQDGHLEAGLVQSDVAHWAFTGTGILDGQEPSDKLRAIGSLYTESIHLVARKEANILSIADLRDKRVSLDEPGSGTLVDATILLNAYGLNARDLKAEYNKPEIAKSRLLDGKLDAFFIVGGFPISSISELAATNKITLVPIDGPHKSDLLSQVKFFSENVIPANTYPNIGETNTIGVGALLLVSKQLPNTMVYDLTKKLWSEDAREILIAGHEKGKEITKPNLNKGVTVPYHAGALEFYNEINLPVSE